MMANLDTIISITDNLISTLKNEGIRFSTKRYEDVSAVPASLIPFGEVHYKGESFEYTHGQRAGYVEAVFLLKVVLRERSSKSMIRDEQSWVHRIRDAATVASLNVEELSASKLVSFVEVSGVEIQKVDTMSILSSTVKVRYREV
jgi:hypothetical protein